LKSARKVGYYAIILQIIVRNFLKSKPTQYV